MAHIYAAAAAAAAAQQTTSLDSLNLPPYVKADIEKRLQTSLSVQYTVDGSSLNDLQRKYDVAEHISNRFYACRLCRAIASSKEQLINHQCPANLPLNPQNFVKIEQVQFRCAACVSAPIETSVFSKASEFIEHANKFGHSKSRGLVKRKDETNLIGSPLSAVAADNKRFKY